jgi:predicted DNA-binding antitoxin AbrB/MazE fold protein
LEKGTREGITEGEKPPVYIEINDETTADAIKYRKLVQTELEKILTHPYLC